MQDFICLVQDGEDESARWYFECSAENQEHAQEQALDHSADTRVISVYQRIS